MDELNSRVQRFQMNRSGYLAAGLFVFVLAVIVAYFAIMPTVLPA